MKKIIAVILTIAMLMTMAVAWNAFSVSADTYPNMIVNPSFEDGTEFSGTLDGTSYEQKTLVGWELITPANGAGIVKRNAGFTTPDPYADGDSYAGFIHGGNNWGIKQTITQDVSINRTYMITFETFMLSTNSAHTGRQTFVKISDQNGAVLKEYGCVMVSLTAVTGSTQFTTNANTTSLTIELWAGVDNVQIDLLNLYDPSGLPVETPEETEEPELPEGNLVANPSFEDGTLISGGSKRTLTSWTPFGIDNDLDVRKRPAGVSYIDPYATASEGFFAMNLIATYIDNNQVEQEHWIEQTITEGIESKRTYSLSFLMFHANGSYVGDKINVQVSDQNQNILHTGAFALKAGNTAQECTAEFFAGAGTESLTLRFETERDYMQMDLVILKLIPQEPEPAAGTNLLLNPSFEDGDVIYQGAPFDKKSIDEWDVIGSAGDTSVVLDTGLQGYTDEYADVQVGNFAARTSGPWNSEIYGLSQTVTTGIRGEYTYQLKFLMMNAKENLGLAVTVTDQTGAVLLSFSAIGEGYQYFHESFTTNANTRSVKVEFIGETNSVEFDIVNLYKADVTGDANGDGALTSEDVVDVKMHLLGLLTLTPEQIAQSKFDVNVQDLGVTDLVNMKKIITSPGN